MPGAGARGRGDAPRPPQREEEPGVSAGREQGGEREGDARETLRMLPSRACGKDGYGFQCVRGPRRAEIESVGGICREVCGGQYQEDSSSHQLSVR